MNKETERPAGPARADDFPADGEAAQARPNRRTLRRRVRKLFYLAGAINILIFACSMLALTAFIFKPITSAVSGYISMSIAEEMSSPAFLSEMGVDKLDDFDGTTGDAPAWKSKLDRMTKIDYFIPFMKDSSASGGGTKAGGFPFALHGETAEDDMIYVRVELGGKTIYSNYEAPSMAINGLLERIDRLYASDVVKPLMNAQGRQIGSVKAGITPTVTLILLGFAFAFFAAMVVAMLLFTLVLSKFFTIPVLKPLRQLNDNIQALARDHYEDMAGHRIELKRPLREIESLADSTNLIMRKMNHYSGMLQNQKLTLEEQNEELEAQNNELTESKAIIQAAQQEIARKEAALTNLLNHAGQGFLTFGPDLVIDPVYSLECARLLDPSLPIAGTSFPEHAAMGDEEQRVFMENILIKILQDKDRGRRAIYMPLLIDEITRQGRTVRIEYKIIPDPEIEGGEMFMAVLTDITEKRALQSQMETERNTLKMVVKVMVHYEDFAASVKDFRKFLLHDMTRIAGGREPEKDKLAVLFRQLHTFKGTFAQWGLIHVTERLHEAETLLSGLGKLDGAEQGEAAARLRDLDLPGALDEDLRLLRATVGDDFFRDRDVLMVDKTKLLEIEKKMLTTLSPLDYKLLLPELLKLSYKPFKGLLKMYPDYVAGLAERMDKYVHPFDITGDEFLADTDKYGDLGRSLVHIFRNAVDHGIEPIEERIAAGKEDYANIICRTELKDGELSIMIADDGRGIDTDALRARALAAGIAGVEELDAMSQRDVQQLVFRDELSTREQVTELSGRGIGLSSVKEEVEKLGGRISVASEAGRGTVFHIAVPEGELTELPQLGIPAVIEPLAETAVDFFLRQIGVDFDAGNAGPVRPVHGKNVKLPLNKLSTFIHVKGAIEGMFIMTVDDRLSRTLLRHMVIGELTPEEENDYMEDSLAEAANIVLGNSMKRFGRLEELIMMDPPITFHTEGASIKYADSESWICRFASADGELRVGFVILKKSSYGRD